MTRSRFRLFAPFLAALLVLGLSLAAAWLYFQTPSEGLTGFLQNGLQSPHARAFLGTLFLRELLPLYMGAGILLWLGTYGLSLLVQPALLKDWGFAQAFGLTLTAFAWIHLMLWWQVPTSLWVIPGF